jgi:hypothetical protein
MQAMPSAYNVVEAYAHPDEYLDEALLRLDVMIECEMERLAAGAPAAEGTDAFRGMFMAPEEAAAVLMEDRPLLRLPDDRRALLDELDLRIAARLNKSRRLGLDLPILALYDRLRLSELEVRIVIAALAPHVNRKYLRLYGYLHDDMTRQAVTLDLLFRLCCRTEAERQAALAAMTNEASVLKHLFVKNEAEDAVQDASILLAPVRLTVRMIHFLLGTPWTYRGPLASVRLHAAPPGDEASDVIVNRRLHRDLVRCAVPAADSGELTVLHLFGAPGSGKTFHARHLCGALGRPLIEWDISRAPEEETGFKEAVGQFLLEARLHDAIPAFDRVMRPAETAGGKDRRLEWLLEALRSWMGLVFVFGESECKPPLMPFPFTWVPVCLPPPDLEESRRLWLHFAGGHVPITDADAGLLAGKFRFTPGQIRAAVEHAHRLTGWNGLVEGREADRPPSNGRRLHEAAYRLIHHRLQERAVKISAKYTWDDLVLPAETIGLLRQACRRLQYRHKVMNLWGFDRKLPYGRGISMLFTGPPGTGKTMSAIVMANEMEAELYRVDLSRVVSKYIGETEKNLAEIFDQARLSGAVLFFDEADALFGKRSEVKDAHDKYANMETSYLLQKMEEYDGLTILATNFAQNLDEAFTRRIQFIIKFPFPDAAQREQLWRSSFPRELPTEEIDFAFLAQNFELSGGPIKNIVLTAAYLAAGEGEAVTMKHLVEGLIQEYKKTGKLFPKDRLGAYAQYWKGG